MMSRVVGRDRLVERLVALLGAGRAAVVLAPPGAGLSTVLRGVVTEARRSGRSVGYLRFPDERVEEIATDRVLVVDDAHRATDVQALALRDRAVEGGVVIGVRTGAAVEALSWLWRSGQAERVELDPLDAGSVEAIIEERVGGAVHGSLVTGIAKRSAGRPAFVVDEIESMRLSGADVEEAGFVRDRPMSHVGVPLVERAENVLAELPVVIADAVRVVAMAGALPVDMVDHFDVDVRELARRRLVGSAVDTMVRLEPPGLAIAVRATLAPARAAEIARRLLELDEDHLAVEDSARLRLVLGDPLDLAQISAAAWAAITDRELTSAVVLAGSAATYGPAGVIAAAEIYTNVGNRVEAAQCYADVLADDNADGFVKARAATEYASSLLWDLGRPDDAVRVAADLTATTRGGPFASLGLIHEAAMRMYSARPTGALELLALVEESEVQEPWGRVLRLVRLVSTSFVRPGVPRSEDVTELTMVTDERMGETFGPAVGVIAVQLGYELAGHHAEAAAVVEGGRRDARLHITPLSAAWLALAEARSELGSGRAGPAKRAALEAAASFADVNHPSGLRWATGASLLAAAMAGDAPACRDHAARLASLAPGAPFLDADLVRAQAWGAWATGDSVRAAELFVDAASMARGIASPTLEAVALHDSYRLLGASVGPRLDELEAVAPVPAIELRARHVRLVAAGLPAELLDLARDLESFGALLLSAVVASDAADVAARQGRRGTARDAEGHRARLMARCGDPTAPGLLGQRSSPLTNRERDIATRAAGGRSSRGIADDLDLSVRTVDNVLQRVYIKLGIHGRAELSELIGFADEPGSAG